MTTIGFDTATAALTVAVRRDGETVAEVAHGPAADGRPRHSELLLAEVERCAEAAGGWDAVDRLGVGLGPGSFTGLRIGIATARAIAQARELPLAGVASTSALLTGIAELPDAADRPHLAVLDARRGQAFAAVADAGGEPGDPAVLSPEALAELAAGLGPAVLAAGDGALRFREQLEAVGVTVAPPGEAVHRIAARHICALSEQAEPRRPDEVEPIYLREPDAKRWIQEQRDRAG